MASRFRKPSASIQVADGAGGLRPLTAHSLDDGPWMLERTVPAADAVGWMAHWHAVAESCGWSGGVFTQLDAAHNAGSLSAFLATGPAPPSIDCAWERVRRGDLQVRLRPGGSPPPPAALVAEFLAQIEDRLQRDVRERLYRRGWLEYDGLPWTGELWLTDTLRLGPPSRFPPALLGPQVVIVDAVVEGIGHAGLQEAFTRQLRELALVLSPILGVALGDRMQFRQGWVAEIDEQNRYTDCRVHSTGYVELDMPSELPRRGTSRALPLIEIARPGLERSGIRPAEQCIKAPADLAELWHRFEALRPPQRDQFLRACNAYGIARSMFPDQRTAYATFLVVACEALKPLGRNNKDANVYDVVATLIDAVTAMRLKAMRYPPQAVRSGHVHRGELAASELANHLDADVFRDPSFDATLQELSKAARLCLIEWLRHGGMGKVNWMPRPASQTRRNTSAMRSARPPRDRR